LEKTFVSWSSLLPAAKIGWDSLVAVLIGMKRGSVEIRIRAIRSGSSSSSLLSSARSALILRRLTQKWSRSAAMQRFSNGWNWSVAPAAMRAKSLAPPLKRVEAQMIEEAAVARWKSVATAEDTASFSSHTRGRRRRAPPLR
jgi:hypothetical protein